MCIICRMVSRWCGCEGHLLSGVEATCTVLLCALEAVVGLPSHTQCRHHHRHGLCTKHFSRSIYQPLSAPNSWWYWKPFDIFKVSGNWPLAKFLQLISNCLKLLKMLWNQILMWDGLFSLLTVRFIRSDKVSKYHMAPRVSCLLSLSRDPSFYNNIFLSSDDLFSWNK